MERVEIVEDDGEPFDDRPLDLAAEDAWTSAVRAWLWRHRGPVVAVVAVLLIALAGAQTVAVVRDRARSARLADTPGLIAPVGPDLRVRWTAGPTTAAMLFGAGYVGGAVVGGTVTAEEGVVLLGLDPTDGTQRWRTVPDVVPTVRVDIPGWVTCAPAHTRPVTAVCTAYVPADQDVQQAVWVLDPRDGTLLRSAMLPAQTSVLVADGLVVSAARAGGPETARWTVTGADALTGETTWTFTTPPLTVPTRREETSRLGSGAGLYLGPTPTGRVTLQAGERYWLLDAHDGTALRAVRGTPHAGGVVEGRGDALLEMAYDSAQETPGVLLLPAGRRVPVDGWPLWSAVDDGSVPEVLLLTAPGGPGGTTLSARDGRSGDPLWSLPVQPEQSVVLDGRLYVMAQDALVAVDLRTGQELWRTRVPSRTIRLATDAERLLLVGADLTVGAYALGDGRLLWERDLHDEIRRAASPTAGTLGVQPGEGFPWLVVLLSDESAVVLG